VILYLQVGPLTTDSTRMSRVLSEPDKKSTHIKICKKISTQSNLNLWWAGLTRRFQPIFPALKNITNIYDAKIVLRMKNENVVLQEVFHECFGNWYEKKDVGFNKFCTSKMNEFDISNFVFSILLLSNI